MTQFELELSESGLSIFVKLFEQAILKFQLLLPTNKQFLSYDKVSKNT